MKYDNLTCSTLNAEMRTRTTDYWYLIQHGGTSHTAFRTRDALLTWLNALGLKLAAVLPEHGTHAFIKIEGSYKRELSMCSREQWDALPGISVTVLENGRYLPGKLSEDVDGVRLLRVSNCNNAWNVEVPWQLAQKLHDAGVMVL